MGLGAETVGVLFYKNIFTIAPSVRYLFSFKDIRLQKLYDSAPLKAQGKKAVNMLNIAVKLLDNPDELVPILNDLGKRHVLRSVKKEYYPVVGEALIATLKAGLGADFTEDAQKAWEVTYQFISDTMISDNYDLTPARKDLVRSSLAVAVGALGE